jgi:glycosyl hydrolase family 25
MKFYNILDANHDTDFPEGWEKLIQGLFHKASQGATFTDPKFSSRMAASQKAGLPFAAYHFATADPVLMQVNRFLKSIGHSSEIATVLDWEDYGDDTMSEADARTFVEAIANATGAFPILYGSDRITESKAAKEYDAILSQCPLWLAHPIKGDGPLPADFAMPEIKLASWSKISLIQYSDDPPGYHKPAIAAKFPGGDWNACDELPFTCPMAKPKMHLDLKKNALRDTLHVPVGQKIPAAKLEAATHSKDPLTAKRARLAKAMRGWHHPKKS